MKNIRIRKFTKNEKSLKKHNFNQSYQKSQQIRKEKQFKKYLSQLPIPLQKKIYILCFRNFWREYVPLTAKIPSWYPSKIIIEKELFESRIQNIHFMHLSFNTLPHTKKWIIGCQCDFCLNYSNKKKIKKQSKKLFGNPDYFNDIMPASSQNSNNYLIFHKQNILYKNYDPLCGSVYERADTYSILKNAIPYHFSEPIPYQI